MFRKRWMQSITSSGQSIRKRRSTTERQHVQRLVECDKFVLDRWEFDQPQSIGGDERCHLLSVLDGACEVSGDPAGKPLSIGQTMLLPAGLGSCQLIPRGRTTLLDIYLP